jgi:hypothetical protein
MIRQDGNRFFAHALKALPGETLQRLCAYQSIQAEAIAPRPGRLTQAIGNSYARTRPLAGRDK